jgi:hypothetical protein
MTFDPAVPLNSDSPSIFPAQNQTNMSRLRTIIAADHQFNNTAAGNDGYHNLIHMTLQAPSGALASTGRFYSKISAGRVHSFYMDNAAAEYQITPTMPIRASVNFTGSAVNGAQVIRSQYNVASVTRTSTGGYTVAFTTAMPDNNYIVQVCGMRDSDDVLKAFVRGSGTYGNSMATTFVRIGFAGSSSAFLDPLMGSVIIFSVT